MKTLLFVLLLATKLSLAQECTSQWSVFFNTDPLLSKVISGDSNAGYATLPFWGDPELELEIHGTFPRARFLSFETERTRFPTSEDALFDYQIEPNPGSENPFRNGVATETPSRAYTIRARPDKKPGDLNTIRLTGGNLINALMLRIYRPNSGVTLSISDLPKVYAKNLRTGNAMNCPLPAPRPIRWHFPEFLASFYASMYPLQFSDPGHIKVLGFNSAANYTYALSELNSDQVVVVRFKAPSSVRTSEQVKFEDEKAQVRYWSFCVSNFTKNQTLNCVPDSGTSPSADGFTYIAIGTGELVKKAAEQRGYSFLPDERGPYQKAVSLVYRNLVPQEAFRKNNMFQKEYKPEGKLCSSKEFISKKCVFH